MKNLLLLIVLSFILSNCINKNVIKEQNKSSVVRKNKSHSEIIELDNNFYEVTESVVIVNITPEQAKEIAIQRACKKAIEFYSGVEVIGRVVDIKAEKEDKILLDSFSSITQQTTQGIIIDKELINEKTISNGNLIEKVVTLKILVGKQKGEKDPLFKIEARLNREYFTDGEEIELEVTSSKNCYLTVFNICSNDSVYIIFPNKFRKNNFVESGEVFKLPNSNDKKNGLIFTVNLLPNKLEDVEMIKVIALKQKVDFSSIFSLSAYGTYKKALSDLQKWLLNIPRSEIEEVNLLYQIIK